MQRFRYTDAMLQFLREEYPRLDLYSLTDAFNARFGTEKAVGTIRSALKNYRITCGRKRGAIRLGKNRLMTDEQAAWLIEHYKTLDRHQVTDAFNQQWGTSLTVNQIIAWLKRNGIICGRTGQFGTRTPWNAGTKGVCKPNKGSFSKGQRPDNTMPMYAEREANTGYIEIKVPGPNPWTGRESYWVAKQRHLWEVANNKPLPKGHVVIFKDTDRRNFDLDNLACISRRQLSMLNQNGYFSAPAELRPSIWALSLVEVATARHTLADPDKTCRQMILDAIRYQPKTTHQISAETGIRFETVATTLTILSKQDQVYKAGKSTAGSPYGRMSVLWQAVSAAARQPRIKGETAC